MINKDPWKEPIQGYYSYVICIDGPTGPKDAALNGSLCEHIFSTLQLIKAQILKIYVDFFF